MERLKISRGTFTAKRDRGTPTKKVKGKNYMLFTLNNEKPVSVCFMAF